MCEGAVRPRTPGERPRFPPLCRHANFVFMDETPHLESVTAAVREALGAGCDRFVLAVSGGCDSMTLLHAAALVAPDRIAAVATFDHGTGTAASSAVDLVCREAGRLGFPAIRGGGPGRTLRATEAAWRGARWEFLRQVASRHGARTVTAHTRDDQVETVLMRILRGSGARGLAGLDAAGTVLRPFRALDRGTLRAYARATGVRFVDDPTNASPTYLRNRVRLHLLPALRIVRPGIEGELLAIADRAVRVRAGLDACASRLSSVRSDGSVVVAASSLRGYSRESLAALWPAVAARAGMALDRRGTERLVAFTISGSVGGRVPVSGRWELHRGRRSFEFRRATIETPWVGARLSGGVVEIGAWRFTPGRERPADPWTATLPPDVCCEVRRWRPGDRMIPAGSGSPRRVKRFLSDAGLCGVRRSEWPVVVADGRVIWIPGVRRSDAAIDRSGTRGVAYECEFNDR